MLKPESFDAVYFVGSIVHMHSREGIIRRMTRALKPGGRLFISDCYYPEQVRGDRNSRATTYILHEVLGYLSYEFTKSCAIEDGSRSYVAYLQQTPPRQENLQVISMQSSADSCGGSAFEVLLSSA